MGTRIAAAWKLASMAVLLAACGSPVTVPPAPGVPARGLADCGPCCGKDPAAQASATQGISPANPANPYTGKDSYVNVIVGEGTVLYSLTPGMPPGFAVAGQTLREANGSREKYYDLVQVTSDPGKDAQGVARKLRDRVQAFQVIEPVCAARGIAHANPQFGRGGGTQYYVSPSDVAKLRPGQTMPISQWRSQGAGE